MPDRKYGEPYRKIRLCVDSYAEGVMQGRMCHPGLDESGTEFHSLAQMLLKIDGMMDDAQFPQSFTAKRRFAAMTEKPHGMKAGTAQMGKEATFVIRVMFRQHTSWQGTVAWVEGHNEESFRSVLELILLMDSALGGCAACAAETA